MNLYDTKLVTCMKCGRYIGEVESSAKIVLPRCGRCTNSKEEDDDIFSYLASRFENSVKNIAVIQSS